MKDQVIVYHNPRCSKSRNAINFLNEKGVDYKIIEYLKEIPTKKELKEIIAKLGVKPEDLIRKGEDDYKNNFKDKKLSDSEWIDALIKYPKLIERPIVLNNGKAVIARPTERILEVL